MNFFNFCKKDENTPYGLGKGYTRMGEYEGSGYETGKKGYYFSTVGGHSVFSQGIMQTVQNTAMGVDIRQERC